MTPDTDELERVLARCLGKEGAFVLLPQRKTVAQGLLMKLVTERRFDLRPAHIARIRAMLTDDRESIALEVVFGEGSDDIVDVYFDVKKDEVLDASTTEGAFIGVVELLNRGAIVY